MKKIAYIISDIDKALAFEWVAVHLNKKAVVVFVLLSPQNTQLSKFLESNQIRYINIGESGKYSRLVLLKRLFFTLRNEKPDIVHTHMWQATLLGLFAAWALRIPKRIFTRHHASIHYTDYKSGIKWDKLCNRLATDIVAISKNIEEILRDWDKASKSKIHLIHHGFDFDYFTNVSESRIEALKVKYNLLKIRGPIVGVISRYIELKGIQYIIPAFNKLRTDFPRAHLILANSRGNYSDHIRQLLRELPLGSYSEIEFESDLSALYRIFDVFVHVPIDLFSEAFGQTYVEPLIVGIPSVFTISGVAKEFIRDKENAYLVDYKNEHQIYDGMKAILSDEIFKNRIVQGGKNSIEIFKDSHYFKKLDKLYGIDSNE